jgi:hypothetical protein
VNGADVSSGSQTLVNNPIVLVVAGDGGDAFSGPIRPSDPLAFTGRVPTGGNGGSILNFSQSVGQDVNVNLIAGNGGSLQNAGSTTDLKAKVGRGGSITNVAVAGRIGDAGDAGDVNVPIKAFNPLFDGDPTNDRMADFVRTRIVGSPLDPFSPLVPLAPISGDDGNVGIVVGGKGRVRDTNNDGVLDPAPDVAGSVPNGSLKNVVASHIMSAVADSVDRIASIQVLKNVRVFATGGEYGSDKAVDSYNDPTTSEDAVPYTAGPTPGSLDYLRADGTYVKTPVLGGRLVDGAIVAKTSRTPQSDRDFKIG